MSVSCRYNHREYKGALTWIEPTSSTHFHQFSEMHIKGGAKLAFLTQSDQGSVTVDRFHGDRTGYIFVGIGQRFSVLKTDADLPFNARVYERGELKLPFKLYFNGVSVRLEEHTKVGGF